MSPQIQPNFVLGCRATSLRAKICDESKILGSLATAAQLYSSFADALRSEMQKLLDELDAVIGVLNESVGPLPHFQMDRIEGKAIDLFSEALALRMADSIRGRLDLGMCTIADMLLSELATAVTVRVPHLSTVAEAEYYATSSRVIRLRYPTKSIWDLPVLAHEFGHSFGPSWTVPGAIDSHPHDTFVKVGRLGSRTLNDEYFCDMLATFLLGPAYVAMCILDRFNPVMATDGETHPSHLKRAWWILHGLDLLADKAEDKDDFRTQAALLRSVWDNYRSSCSSDELTDNEKTTLDYCGSELFGKLYSALPLAGYRSSSVAWGLVADYVAHGTSAPGSTLRDILNASWFARINYGTRPDDISAIASWAHGLAGRSTK